jgi:hypothetical protein
MTLSQWDKEIAPHLQEIESYAKLTGANSRMLTSAIRTLPARPDWETRAAFELAATERELMAALATVRAARKLYADKQVTNEAVA